MDVGESMWRSRAWCYGQVRDGAYDDGSVPFIDLLVIVYFRCADGLLAGLLNESVLVLG